jgi:hypothetical protein
VYSSLAMVKLGLNKANEAVEHARMATVYAPGKMIGCFTSANSYLEESVVYNYVLMLLKSNRVKEGCRVWMDYKQQTTATPWTAEMISKLKNSIKANNTVPPTSLLDLYVSNRKWN